MALRCQVRAALALAAALAAARVAAAPKTLQAEGSYSDDFTDDTGLSFEQNIKKTFSTTFPGVRLAPSSVPWAFVQPSAVPPLPAKPLQSDLSFKGDPSDTVAKLFSGAGAAFRLTTPNACATCLENVTLWNATYHAGRDFALGPGAVSSTGVTWGPNAAGFAPSAGVFAHHSDSAALRGQYFVRGPYANNLEVLRAYTATFRPFYCDNENCTDAFAVLTTDGPLFATFDVYHGASFASYATHLKNYLTSCSALKRGDFLCEGMASPVTLEWRVPSPPPDWNGWEYRVLLSQTTSGFTVTLWMDSVEVQAKGHEIQNVAFLPPGTPCPPGQVVCGTGCQAPWLPCGWDAATAYVDEGSYVSPVFDSLSENTQWNLLAWSVEGKIALKWRVGNTPDPSTWLADPSWYTWTVPVDWSGVWPALVMKPKGTASLYADGGYTKDANGNPVYARGRYFQYEADLTGNYADDRFPPELAVTGNDASGNPRSQRELHDVSSPVLHSLWVTYTAARGQVVSQTITPTQLKRWNAVTYTADTSTGGMVQVDVLDENQVPLFAAVPNGFSLAGLDPRRYPRLRLRGWVDSGGDPTRRPVLLGWGVTWDLLTDPLEVSRNAISAAKGETVTVTAVFDSARDGAVAVRDASGQLIRVLSRGVIPAGVSRWTWDGTNDADARVAPGVYFISLNAGDTRQVKSVAVVP